MAVESSDALEGRGQAELQAGRWSWAPLVLVVFWGKSMKVPEMWIFNDMLMICLTFWFY